MHVANVRERRCEISEMCPIRRESHLPVDLFKTFDTPSLSYRQSDPYRAAFDNLILGPVGVFQELCPDDLIDKVPLACTRFFMAPAEMIY